MLIIGMAQDGAPDLVDRATAIKNALEARTGHEVFIVLGATAIVVVPSGLDDSALLEEVEEDDA